MCNLQITDFFVFCFLFVFVVVVFFAENAIQCPESEMKSLYQDTSILLRFYLTSFEQVHVC